MRQCIWCGFKTDAPFDSDVLHDHSKTHQGSKGFRDTGMWKDYDAEFSKRFVQGFGLLFLGFGIVLGIAIGVNI